MNEWGGNRPRSGRKKIENLVDKRKQYTMYLNEKELKDLINKGESSNKSEALRTILKKLDK